ncbi:beta-galactosidase trimerization domain-containing protein [Tuwongella immobilis]|uniref:Beta-galactosidase trimerisation domain-containing protein n=1 Tax=Tuwongella immobilis TaxID=692036 RepID=A0A6C2YMA8_9BACT|nr:beta-galactosidase trimerization domain-containing protein [Tuwongella immobilis]VIP02215.1 beta-galactosidase : Uncharacterized protein OS=Candidatus Entotheonella sp. TSY1 GN=ETSY1_37755 PE=4 SV=1: Glyco_hydro_42M [Tuwongella immobilis]VTS00732.1 beta-galactosidase : Uncharacterized protein OS=Candidatus Entotheonella sp. TSY1 GN=ETSY1_37755 PE=4 SV=1: Glyco_hydro_42M [Tuwongella immobilis]
MPCQSCRSHPRAIRWPVFALALGLMTLVASLARGEVVIAEGEQFTPTTENGWKVTHQDDTYGSHTYGGMWMTHGGCLGAAKDVVDAVAAQSITIPKAGAYRIWSKYQAPPYFNYLHRIEIIQGGKVVFSHDYGRKGTDRLWSFSGQSNELWWPWGTDHDTAEGSPNEVLLAAGPAAIRLTALKNPERGGDRFVDFVVLTTDLENRYQGFQPYSVGSPFTMEAFAASKLYVRFRNTTAKPAKLSLSRAGHYQPQYGGATMALPDQPIPAGEWSPWVNIGPFCRLVHDEGLTVSLPEASEIPLQFARDAAGNQSVGAVMARNQESVVIPIDVTWNPKATVKLARTHAEGLIAQAKTWRKASATKPKQLLFYGAFVGNEPWVHELKHTMGYNTILPDSYPHAARDDLHAHASSPDAIKQFANQYANKSKLKILSFGDEIHVGRINFQDAKQQAAFQQWIAQKKLTADELGVPPTQAKLTDKKDDGGRLLWYSNRFNEEQRFSEFRAMTELTEQLFGPEVLTGANYSPHHLALCYGPVYQWVDLFKYRGMSMLWAEDYIFSVPEVPQMVSWMFAQIRAGSKYHQLPIHFYVMPHAPGQTPENLRRNMLLSIGYGASHINSFWVGPPERFTENYINWHYPENYRVITESIHDTAAIETMQTTGKLRPAKVALILSQATDFHEARKMVDRSADPFTAQCKNAPKELNSILARKEQQYLYLALVQAGYAVDLITEDDIVDLGVLKNYQVVYQAGEWLDRRTVPLLEAWVKAGGSLVATAGLGLKNQYDQPEPAMAALLGITEARTDSNLAVIRTLLELPLADPIDQLKWNGKMIPAFGMRQRLSPIMQNGPTVIATWSDGSAAGVQRNLGQGTITAIGTTPGTSWMKSGLRVQPYARGGRHTVYNPTDFDASAADFVRLGLTSAKLNQEVTCSAPHVEAIPMDSPTGTLLTLVNWNNAPLKEITVTVRMPASPKEVRSIAGQRVIPHQFADGKVTFTIPLADADYVTLVK